MRLFRTMLWGLAALGAAGVGASCDDETAAGADDFCGALGGYVSSCGELSDCENAVVRDCESLETALSPAYSQATTDCMNSLGTPMSCLADSVDTATSSPALEEFAETLCLECGDGAGPCEDDVLRGEGSDDLAAAGRLARVLSDETIKALADECATGEACAANFETCAVQVLGRSIPNATAQCVANAVLRGPGGDCENASGADDVGDGGPGGGSDGGGTDSGGDSDGSDTNDDGGPGGCASEGCDCEFTEDCDDGLVCASDVCTVMLECTDDANETNDSEDTATFLPPIGDSDAEGSTMSGELGEGDIDWFRYEGSDNFGSSVNPFAGASVNALEVCIYAECLGGVEFTDLSCSDGTTQRPSAQGRPGCCASETAGFEITIGCNDTYLDDSATIFMSVAGAGPGICQEYTLSYHF